MAVYSVAKYFGVDPSVVEYDWYYLDYLDRLNYMQYQDAVEFEAAVANESPQKDKP